MPQPLRSTSGLHTRATRLTKVDGAKALLRHHSPVEKGTGRIIILEPGEALFKTGDRTHSIYYPTCDRPDSEQTRRLETERAGGCYLRRPSNASFCNAWSPRRGAPPGEDPDPRSTRR